MLTNFGFEMEKQPGSNLMTFQFEYKKKKHSTPYTLFYVILESHLDQLAWSGSVHFSSSMSKI